MKKRYLYSPFALLTVLLIFVQNARSQNTSPYWSLAGNSNASATTSKLGTTNNIPLRIYTNNVERVRILSTNGNVGVGILTPTDRLHINTPTATNPLRVQVNGNTRLFVHSNGGTAIGGNITPPALGLYVNGNVGIATTAPAARLHITGTSPYTTALRVNNGGLRVTNNWSTGDSSIGIYGEGGIGVYGNGMNGVFGTGMNGVVGEGYTGVSGRTNGGYAGVEGYGAESIGVSGTSDNGNGVEGNSTSGYGGEFRSNSNYGLVARTSTGIYAGVFYGKVWAQGGYVTSDKNLKQNIKEFSDALGLIGKLKPRHYDFKTDAKYAFLNLPKGNQYGLLAQDVEEVLPDLVSTSNHEVYNAKLPTGPVKPGTAQQAKEKPEIISIKAVDYVGLIPVMVKGMQELNDKTKEIDALKAEVAELRKLLLELKSGGTGGSVTVTGAYLEQNTPNPARSSTRIAYVVPENSRAQLVLTDAAGKMVKTIALNRSGRVDINTATLSSGVYNYTLLIDGRTMETKKLTVAR